MTSSSNVYLDREKQQKQKSKGRVNFTKKNMNYKESYKIELHPRARFSRISILSIVHFNTSMKKIEAT